MAEGDGTTNGNARDPDGPLADVASTTPWWLGSEAIESPSASLDVCRFLAADAGGALIAPIAEPDDANRCIALGDAAPQSIRQQELVCLAAGHKSCPRYLRGALLEETPPPGPTRQPVSRAIIGASLILVGSISASFGFLALRGGLTVAIASPSPIGSQVAVVPAASLTPIATASVPAGPAPSSSAGARPSATPAPTPRPTPRTSKPPVTPTAQPSSNRYALLTPCASTPNCWIYTIRAGDNLVSIAHYFGVSLDSVYAMNPWTRTTGLKAGQELRLPPPTR